MSSLGSMFPSEFREEYASEGLKPGAVVRCFCDFIENPKLKYMLVVSVDPKLMILMINTTPTEYIRNRPKLFRCWVYLDGYPFFDYGSYADCVDAHDSWQVDFLKDEVSKNPDTLKGTISDEDLVLIYEAVSDSPRMVRRDKRIIMNAVDNHLDGRCSAVVNDPN